MLSMSSPIDEKMRAEWNERARADAYYYVSTGRRHQDKAEFLSMAEPIVAMIRAPLSRIRSETPPGARRALEIGCGPGRFMLPLSESFSEIYGVDVSDEMIALAREHLSGVRGVHLYRGSGSDLAPLSSEYFDFVYSYAVFQHIPSIPVVTNYLEEAIRVLKPGGVFCCQIRGAPSPISATTGQSDTWTGCVYPAGDVVALCRRLGMHVEQISAADTQYMWVVIRKPLHADSDAISIADAMVKAITPTDNPFGVISPAGPGAAFHCWLEGFPEFTSLCDLEVTIGGTPAAPSYISEHLGRGGFQLNVMVPPATALGDHAIRILWRGQPVRGEHAVRICDYPEANPTIIDVTDGVDLLVKYSTTTGSVKVMLSGIADPGQVSFFIDSNPVSAMAPLLCDAYRFVYDFPLSLPDRLPSGLHSLTVTTANWSETVQVRSYGSNP
jgi:ubiquinone/menaquinone biosynthesis C-methylase UbiE